MCYDIKAGLESQLQRAKRHGDLQAIEEILELLIPLTDLPIHHTSGFNHPSLLIYTSEDPFFPVVSTWGLIPSTSYDKKGIWNKTLNARGETIFELPSFTASARHKRCLIQVDGFYEHHHFKGQTYPFYIHRKDSEPMTLAGLWDEWIDEETGGVWNTFTIVTTEGNTLMRKIHNNPKLKGPRMPVLLPPEKANDWLAPYDQELWDTGQKQALQDLIQSFPEDELTCHTVARIRGKQYKGNTLEISKPVNYPELEVI